MINSFSIVTVESTMAVVPLWLPPVWECHKIEEKYGNSLLNNAGFQVALKFLKNPNIFRPP